MKIKRPISKSIAPKNAKRVFKGEIFDVYQWQQKMYDGSFATFEKLKRSDTVQVIPVTEDGKIILLKQSQPGFRKPCLSVAGGRIDPGETPLRAAHRELLEETGYKAKKMELWYSVQPNAKIDYAVYGFIAKGCRKVAAQNLDAGEKIKIKIVSLQEFLRVVFEKGFYDPEIALRILKESGNWKNLFKDMKAVKKRFLD
ncbi:MAG: NUDIX hydrolase [Patescibacteria group bacterium]|jgi:8-oxo-dGTP pyrophosphatase MutT (NUDIX family)